MSKRQDKVFVYLKNTSIPVLIRLGEHNTGNFVKYCLIAIKSIIIIIIIIIIIKLLLLLLFLYSFFYIYRSVDVEEVYQSHRR